MSIVSSSASQVSSYLESNPPVLRLFNPPRQEERLTISSSDDVNERVVRAYETYRQGIVDYCVDNHMPLPEFPTHMEAARHLGLVEGVFHDVYQGYPVIYVMGAAAVRVFRSIVLSEEPCSEASKED